MKETYKFKIFLPNFSILPNPRDVFKGFSGGLSKRLLKRLSLSLNETLSISKFGQILNESLSLLPQSASLSGQASCRWPRTKFVTGFDPSNDQLQFGQ